MDFGVAIGFGVDGKPDFWLGRDERRQVPRVTHRLRRRPTVPRCDAFFAAAVGPGAEVLHEPRVWPEYHQQLLRRLRPRPRRQQRRSLLPRTGLT